ITLEDRALLEEYLKGYSYRTSGLTYTSLYMWREVNRFSWRKFGDYLCIAAADNLDPQMGDNFMFPPLTRTGSYEPAALRRTVLEAKEFFEARGESFVMMLVPFHMIEVFEQAMPGEFTFEADRPNFDYVYDKNELIELKGKKFHGKKNHLNYFLNNYDYEYTVLTEEMAPEAMAFMRAFNERKNLTDAHERELLEFEEQAMKDVFLNLSKVGYITGVIRIDGKIEALSIGGMLGKKTVTVHVEKANTEFRGLYQAINNEFCRHLPQNITLVNREEDMGIAGLRKAKLSYKPVKLVEKYIIRV
ncbi:MAG: phosphatidylglycerol lysyltransferase domain-containing protein, partial [Clostridiales Family XIII bacterium]|nr:phosphatidylglycerol lysyltransferase domain-containing protein [Clostridiales Family XIII bacterium]